MANLRTIQFLRSSSVSIGLAAAKTALEGQSSKYTDGTPLLARYKETEGDETIKTLLGIAHVGVDGKTGITFFETANEVAARLKELKDELDAAETAVGLASGGTKVDQVGKYISGKSTVEEEIVALNNAIVALEGLLNNIDYGPEGGGDGQVINWIQQTDGKISATTENVGNLKLTDYTEGSASGHVESTDSINEGIAKLQNQIDAANDVINALDAPSVSGDSKVVIDVIQENGQITTSAANLTGVKLDGLTAGTDSKIAAANTLGEALANIQAQIDAMDKDADAVAGQVVTTVSEADGKVTETKANVKDLQLGGYSKTNDTGDIASADTINVALSKLENKSAAITIKNEDGSINVSASTAGTDINVNIKSGEHVLAKDGDAGIYTDLDLVKITTGLPETIKERYQLLATDDSQIGTNIDIPKDSHIVSINYITTGEHAQNLEYVYIDASGNTQTTYVDMSELVLETEFGSGVTVTNHVAHGVVDPTSESFFTVGAGGFKVAGISGFVATEIGKLDATVGDATVQTGKHVAVQVVEEDGVITAVTVSEDDIASAQGLADEITARGDADDAINAKLGNGVTSANTATAQFAALSGNTASTSAETSVEGAKRYADAILANSVAGLDANVSGDSTHVTVGVVEENGVITAVTVSEDNIANADDLAELSGKTITELTSANNSISISDGTIADDGTMSFDLATDTSKIKLSGYTESSATTEQAPANGDTISEALAKIYATAKHHHLTSTNAGISAATTVDGTSVTLTLDDDSALSVNNNSGDTNNALMITDYGLFLSKDWDCGTF